MTKKQKNNLAWGVVAVIIVGVIAAYVLTRPEYNQPAAERPFKGSADAQVLVEEYGDFQCPACGQAYPYLKEVAQTYGDQIRFEYNHYPLTRIHPQAMNAAIASECANDQGKFWEMHDAIFENQTDLGTDLFKQIASDIELDTEMFDRCLAAKAHRDVINADISEGQGRGINATPTILVNGQKVNLRTLETQIELELERIQEEEAEQE